MDAKTSLCGRLNAAATAIDVVITVLFEMETMGADAPMIDLDMAMLSV